MNLQVSAQVMTYLAMLLLSFALPVSGRSQQATMTPLGDIVTPHSPIQVPEPFKSRLPGKVAVRFFEKTNISGAGENVVIYATPDEDHPEIATDPHVVMFNGSEQRADFRVADLFSKEDAGVDFEFYKASEVVLAGPGHTLVLTFRNIGDGAATLFVCIAKIDGRYEVIWKSHAYKAQVRMRGDSSFQLWSANHDGECVWCAQTYSVTTFEWKKGRFFREGRFNTKGELDPQPVADNPIVIEK